MAFRLIPKEERFFEDFVEMAEQIHKAAILLEQMLAPDQPLWDKADEIKEVEHRCDFLTHEVIQRLHKTFVTPLDREDIHTLARTLDDVIDAIDDSASVIRLYQISKVRPDARDLGRIIKASSEQVVVAMKALGWSRAELQDIYARVSDHVTRAELNRAFEGARVMTDASVFEPLDQSRGDKQGVAPAR